MALINPPAWLQQGSYSANTDRQLIGSIVPVAGVVEGFSVIQSPTPSMSISVTAGKAFVSGSIVSNQGMYNVVNDSPVSLTIPASNATNPRRDIIVVTVNDADVSGTVNSVNFQVISGTPSTSPSSPSTPASSILLASIFVAAGASSIVTTAISDRRVFTSTSGGVISVPDAAARLRIADPIPGKSIIVAEASSGLTWKNTGSSWSPFGVNAYVCTSATRPSDPPVGMLIYETDTARTFVYGASPNPRWRFVSGPPIMTATSGSANLTTSWTQITGSPTVTIPETGEYSITVRGVYNFSIAANSYVRGSLGLWQNSTSWGEFSSSHVTSTNSGSLTSVIPIEFTRIGTLNAGSVMSVRGITYVIYGTQFINNVDIKMIRLS